MCNTGLVYVNTVVNLRKYCCCFIVFLMYGESCKIK